MPQNPIGQPNSLQQFENTLDNLITNANKYQSVDQASPYYSDMQKLNNLRQQQYLERELSLKNQDYVKKLFEDQEYARAQAGPFHL